MSINDYILKKTWMLIGLKFLTYKIKWKMANTKILIFLYLLHVSYCDWVSDWMGPLQEQLRQKSASRRLVDGYLTKIAEKKTEIPQGTSIRPFLEENDEMENRDVTVGFKSRLEDTLRNAENLIVKLEAEITILQKKERKLKDAIANGRLGISTVTVSTINKNVPYTYIIRDGVWSICSGIVQYPMLANVKHNIFDDYALPKCIGQEVLRKPHPCVFNSVIKYETVPVQRNLEYIEDDFFCLRPAFNKTLEQYLSVPKSILNNTCQNGVIRSFEENMQQCGERVLSEYTYYPSEALAPSLPLEYCVERDGSCKLIVAWRLSNKTVENFEFLKNENNFKKYFITPTFHIL